MDNASLSTTESSDILNLSEDDGWDDAEQEDNREEIFCLLDQEVFPDVSSMLTHCKMRHNFDFMSVRAKFGLDFYGTIKLVNYIRSQVREGHQVSHNIKLEDFEDEKYMVPVLADDAVLFNLDELPRTETPLENGLVSGATGNDSSAELLGRIAKLEAQLLKTQTQFEEYREVVKRSLDDRWNENDSLSGQGAVMKRDDDSHYFGSYSYNDIHETMLKDTVRTDAYRDFIYNNKELFAGKVVLDVGCGTGILSLFCAKAGASQVIAVDNSAIIDKAREIIFHNHFSDTIACLRGKIEEVTLPVEKVDIIVSEWMGYGLLYEAMLDSVIWARDKYLKPQGLMIPSHINLWIAPISDPDYVMDHISFWRDVHGFDMKAMQAGIHEDAQVLQMPPAAICSEPFPFLQLKLHSAKVQDLTFKREWHFDIGKEIDALDGFAIWFDTFFMPSRANEVPEDARAENWTQKGIAFTTGPRGKETHWRQCVLFIDNISRPSTNCKAGERINGSVEYSIPDDNSRGLDLKASWGPGPEVASQSWKMK